MAPSTLKHELGGGEYWENEALCAKIDGLGTRYNDDERMWRKIANGWDAATDTRSS